jgi:diadenosine tetraphosphate (Ap4A) HIT family hydrolase
MTLPSGCPFCSLEGRVLLQNKQANSFLSNPRMVPGHFLVTPKRHVTKLWDLAPREVADIFKLLAFIQKRLVLTFSAGCDIRQNYRPYMGQDGIKVDHIHFHILPRAANDKLWQFEKPERALFEPLSSAEAGRMAKLLQD